MAITDVTITEYPSSDFGFTVDFEADTFESQIVSVVIGRPGGQSDELFTARIGSQLIATFAIDSDKRTAGRYDYSVTYGVSTFDGFVIL